MHEMEKRTSCVENKVIIIRAVDEGNRLKTCKLSKHLMLVKYQGKKLEGLQTNKNDQTKRFYVGMNHVQLICVYLIFTRACD